MGEQDDAAMRAATSMSISSGSSRRDLVGAIDCPATRRAKELLVGEVDVNSGRKRARVQMSRLGVVELYNHWNRAQPHKLLLTAVVESDEVERRPGGKVNALQMIQRGVSPGS